MFEQAADFQTRLVAAVADRDEGASVVRALHEEIRALVQHCTTGDATGIWTMIERSPELSTYAQVLELRYAGALAAAIQAAPDLHTSEVAADTIARFAMAAFTLARQSAYPEATLDEAFRMIEAAWSAAQPRRET